MTRLLFPICAALLSTLAGLHLSTHLRQEEQRLARWGEILQHLHLLMGLAFVGVRFGGAGR